MIIMGFNQLQAILGSIQEEPTEELKRELARWLRYMGDLNMHSISLLDPTSAAKDKEEELDLPLSSMCISQTLGFEPRTS